MEIILIDTENIVILVHNIFVDDKLLIIQTYPGIPRCSDSLATGALFTNVNTKLLLFIVCF